VRQGQSRSEFVTLGANVVLEGTRDFCQGLPHGFQGDGIVRLRFTIRQKLVVENK
jgi:hypothetical protein